MVDPYSYYMKTKHEVQIAKLENKITQSVYPPKLDSEIEHYFKIA